MELVEIHYKRRQILLPFTSAYVVTKEAEGTFYHFLLSDVCVYVFHDFFRNYQRYFAEPWLRNTVNTFENFVSR